MRSLIKLALALLTLAAQSAIPAPMGVEEARHLLNRTGFAATPREIEEYSRFSREQAVARLLREAGKVAVTPLPASAEEYFRPSRLKNLAEEEKKALLRQQFEAGADLRGWWLAEMLRTPSPLTERMTLFWHNHFVSSQQKVKSVRLMALQNTLLRHHALGNFGALLHAVAKDPAMVIYLDAATNRKGQPNENFAREVMELFTLGEGNYAELDVKEAARAFTGWSLEPETGEFKWRPFVHDEGVKTVLGQSGNFNGDDVLDILLAQPQTADFIVGKLWREFVSPAVDAREADRIARHFRASNYEIGTVLSDLLLSSAFWAKENRAVLVKSPVELVAGALHQFEFSMDDPLPFVFTLRQLGQDLFGPPNVKGWPGGEAWINSTTLLARKQFLERLFRGQELMQRMRSADGEQMRHEEAPGDMLRRAAQLREASGKDGNRMGDQGRARMLRAIESIRFDSSAWLEQIDRFRLSPQLVMLPGAPATAGGNPAGLDLIRMLALDPMYQLK
jgi:uncharacterized protein (DUF1800 family)